MTVVLIAPGRARNGTASGTTPENAPASSSFASAGVWHARIKGAIPARMEDILSEHPPRNPMAL